MVLGLVHDEDHCVENSFCLSSALFVSANESTILVGSFRCFVLQTKSQDFTFQFRLSFENFLVKAFFDVMNATDSKIVFQKAFNSSLGLFDVNIVLYHDCFSVSKFVPPQLLIQVHSPFVNEVFTGLLLHQLKVFLAHSIHR